MLTVRRDRLPEMIMRLEQAGQGFRVPILRAVFERRMGFVESARGGQIPAKVLRDPRPHLILLGDDDLCSSGPAGWPQGRRLLRWCRRVMIHATGGEPQHYALAVEATESAGRVLLIETDMVHMPAWLALVQERQPPVPTLVLRPHPGEPAHPTCPAVLQ
jgi:hypothetical protein